ncbi:MAG: hypothetical protein ABL900_13510 [Burkholderiaceae bacterium]
MKFLSVLTVPAAFALIVASTASAAQDKPNTAAATKPSSTANASAKAKPTWQGSTQLKNTLNSPSTERSAGKPQSTPEVTRAAPAGEGGYKSCHGKDSDA